MRRNVLSAKVQEYQPLSNFTECREPGKDNHSFKKESSKNRRMTTYDCRLVVRETRHRFVFILMPTGQLRLVKSTCIQRR